ncbi:spermatogenesis- and oogenesis-specific basic helix-loop-helix-containing protein 1 [Rhynchocyon petersi]
MASGDPAPAGGTCGVPKSVGCSTAHRKLFPYSGDPGPALLRVPKIFALVRSRSTPGTLVSSDVPSWPQGQGSCRRRNVLKERERRKRISGSCERLRALLPWFDSRREDMASVLEMAVQFLRLAHALVPAQGQHVPVCSQVPGPSLEVCPQRWHRRALQGAQAVVSMLDSGTSELGLARPQESPCGAPLGVDGNMVLSGLNEVPSGPPGSPGQLVPGEQGLNVTASPREPPELSVSKLIGGQAPTSLCPPWAPLSQLAALPANAPGHGCPSLAGGMDPAMMPMLDTRSVPGPDVEEDPALLLATSHDWWLGSLEGHDGVTPTPVDRAELGLPGGSEPGYQELQDSLLEQCGRDLGCAGLALREESDSLFPDLFACRP